MFPHLQQPIMIGPVRLKNRLTAAPCVSNLATEDGFVTERLVDLYHARGKGGWSLVTVEAAYIRPDGTNFPRMLGINDDRQIPGLKELADVIHEGGAVAGIQLQHSGRAAAVPQPIGPSDTAPLWRGKRARTLSDAEVEGLIQAHVDAALRAKAAGFDLVNLHAAHGFLLQQFMSPLTNHRKDRWGERTAFVCEVIRRVKKAVGPNMALVMRISGDECLGEAGLTIEDMAEMAPKFVEAGIDSLDVSAGARESIEWITQPLYMKRGVIVHLAEAIKKVVDVPVVTAGRIMEAKHAEVLVKSGRTDLVSMTRAMICDPDLPRKSFAGMPEEVRHCLACDACINSERQGHRVICAMNYDIGRFRWEYEIKPSQEPKRIMVVGGGIAGMEVARVAALRGHQVSIYEKSSELGGAVRLVAANIPHVYTTDLEHSVKYLKRELSKLPVEIHLNTAVDEELVRRIQPDVVVIASGSRAGMPALPVTLGQGLHLIDDYLAERPPLGDTVAVWGGHYGPEIAWSVINQKKHAILIDEGEEVAAAPYIYPARRTVLLKELKEAGAVIVTGRVVAIEPGQVVVEDPASGDTRTIQADTTLVALQRKPNAEIGDRIRALGLNVHVVECGDCKSPRNIAVAMHEANAVARAI